MDIVIPWFLVLTSFGAINNTEPRVDHGPVYVYDVTIDFSRSLERNIKIDYSLNHAFTLRCRPRNASVLFCTLGKKRVTIFDHKSQSTLQRIQIAEESFEINYNEGGVESLRVASCSPCSSSGAACHARYGLIKTITNQLNFGTDFQKHKSFAFTTNETSSFGECETDFTVVASPGIFCRENTTIIKDIKMRSIFQKLLGDSIVLRKRRNTRVCDRPNEVFFIDNNDSIVSTVTSSYSEMYICPGFFESSTFLEGKGITTDGEPKASVFQQVVKLRLRDVERAKEDLPEFVVDTATYSMYLHKDIDNNEFET